MRRRSLLRLLLSVLSGTRRFYLAFMGLGLMVRLVGEELQSSPSLESASKSRKVTEEVYGVFDLLPAYAADEREHLGLNLRLEIVKALQAKGMKVQEGLLLDSAPLRSNRDLLSEAEWKRIREEKQLTKVLYGYYLSFPEGSLGIVVRLLEVEKETIVWTRKLHLASEEDLGSLGALLLGSAEGGEKARSRSVRVSQEKEFPFIIAPLLSGSLFEVGVFPQRNFNQGDGTIFMEGSLGVLGGPSAIHQLVILEATALLGTDDGGFFRGYGGRLRWYPLWIPLGLGVHLNTNRRTRTKDALVETGFNVSLGFFVWETVTVSYSTVRYTEGYRREVPERKDRVIRVGFLRFNIPLLRRAMRHPTVKNGMRWIYGVDEEKTDKP